ncbi:MAG: hypothetical protein ICV87_02275 [Gemmatimonadetes bacterium]|nr:hypothetical protein [Gemmatimonadota bacterium]
MTAPRTIRPDSALSARVLRTTPLLYAEGADPAQDRPAHVRAGSGVAWVGERLVVVQDDAAFLALVDPATAEVRAISLPAAEGGTRQFDDIRGNKHLKADLEACVTVPHGGAELFLAFGSGSSPMREKVLMGRRLDTAEPSVELVESSSLYAALRAERRFSGSEMNIEGAALVGSAVRLFNRGNGAARDGHLPVDASCDLPLAALLAYLTDPHGAPPAIENVVQHDLDAIDTLRLGFTDAAARGGAIYFSAAAEDSPDATRDGRVAGSAIGFLDEEGGRWTLLHDDAGRLFDAKVEGIAFWRDRPDRLWAVVDADDPERPSELCEIELLGSWP